jgi:hypothetical protein
VEKHLQTSARARRDGTTSNGQGFESLQAIRKDAGEKALGADNAALCRAVSNRCPSTARAIRAFLSSQHSPAGARCRSLPAAQFVQMPGCLDEVGKTTGRCGSAVFPAYLRGQAAAARWREFCANFLA